MAAAEALASPPRWSTWSLTAKTRNHSAPGSSDPGHLNKTAVTPARASSPAAAVNQQLKCWLRGARSVKEQKVAFPDCSRPRENATHKTLGEGTSVMEGAHRHASFTIQHMLHGAKSAPAKPQYMNCPDIT